MFGPGTFATNRPGGPTAILTNFEHWYRYMFLGYMYIFTGGNESIWREPSRSLPWRNCVFWRVIRDVWSTSESATSQTSCCHGYARLTHSYTSCSNRHFKASQGADGDKKDIIWSSWYGYWGLINIAFSLWRDVFGMGKTSLEIWDHANAYYFKYRRF